MLDYDAFITILSSCLGGFIGGFYTFKGVKLTIAHSNKIHKENMALKEKEHQEQQKKYNEVPIPDFLVKVLKDWLKC